MAQPPPLPSATHPQRDRFVFVSYARDDKHFVYPEVERLERGGHSLWCDKRDIMPGRDWLSSIDESVDACSCFLLFLSEASAASEYVRYETARAFSGGKVVLCVYLERVRPPWFQDRFAALQGIPRYALSTNEYQSLLREALILHIGHPDPSVCALGADSIARTAPSGVSPKVVVFALAATAGASALFGLFSIINATFFAEALPGDPFLIRLGGWALGVLCLIAALLLGGAALAVYRKHFPERT